MTKLSKAQREAMKQIYKATCKSASMDRITNPTASDLILVSLVTLGALLTRGLVSNRRSLGANSFPRVCIVWTLTVEGMKYCEENFEG